jgi:hypothetical protein
VRKRKKKVDVVDGQTVKQAANPLRKGKNIICAFLSFFHLFVVFSI